MVRGNLANPGQLLLKGHEVIVNLIKATTTSKGLRVEAALDPSAYPAGEKVTDEELARVNLTRSEFHGEWNYTISPRQTQLHL